jgi:hypothetical protein
MNTHVGTGTMIVVTSSSQMGLGRGLSLYWKTLRRQSVVDHGISILSPSEIGVERCPI